MCCYVITRKRIEVFKTNVYNCEDAERIVAFLSNSFPYSRINFDLHDCDKILRIEGVDFTIEKVQVLVAQKGFECCVLD
jgi:predicted RNA binding protein with dsRBD fold (UPF0201 family)